NGPVLTNSYDTAGSDADALSRIAALVDDDGITELAAYSYLGLGTFVVTDYTGPETEYTLIGTAGGNDPDTGDIYRGFDRFGRIKDLHWYNASTATNVERVQHGYDRDSNRLWRADPVDTGSHHDELYGYDGLNRVRRLD